MKVMKLAALFLQLAMLVLMSGTAMASDPGTTQTQLYNLVLTISHDGEVVSKPVLALASGVEGEVRVSGKDTEGPRFAVRVKVTPSLRAPNLKREAVDIAWVISEQKGGSLSVLSKPEVTVYLGELSSIRLDGQAADEPGLQIEFTTTRAL